MFPLYKIDPGKNKIAFNNARSLHKHFKDCWNGTKCVCSRWPLDLPKQDYAVGMKMYILLWRDSDLLDWMTQRKNQWTGLIMDLHYMWKNIFNYRKLWKCNASHLNSYLLAYTAFKEGMFKLLLYCTSSQKVHRHILERIFIVIWGQ